jgi:amidohydrolase family protein
MTSLLLTLALLVPAANQAPDTTRYIILSAGNPAGSELAVRNPDGSLYFFEAYNDRGRGPRLETRITLTPARMFQTLAITGHDYWKQPVDERFALRGDSAEWSSSLEKGRRRLEAPALYSPFYGPVGSLPLLIGAAGSSGEVSLLPTGRARIQKVGERTVSAGGQSARISHYQIEGLGFTPTDFWVDINNRLFAFVAGSWFRVLRPGWESVGDALAAAQDSLEKQRDATVARTLAYHPDGAVIFDHATVFDAPNARLLRDQAVIVRGNRIEWVGPASKAPRGVGSRARLINASGKTLLPGLFDVHTHNGALDGRMHIAAGVTSVRDMANDIDDLRKLRQLWDSGTAIGPRVMMAGFMDGPGPYAGPTKVLVSTRDSALAWVDRYKSLGYEQIKLYSSLDTALVRPIAERAHALGMRLSGHIPVHMTAAKAVLSGYDEIQHINMLFLNFLGDTLETRNTNRFIAPGRYGADLDLNSDSVRAFLQLLKNHHTVLDLTLATFEGMYTVRPGTMDEGGLRIASRMPPEVRRGMLAGGIAQNDSEQTRYRASWAKMLAFAKMLDDNGIQIVAGTDCMAGFCLQRELELYSKAGIPNARVLQIATWGAATVMKRTDRLAAIRPGYLADLLLVNGDPVAEMTNIERVDLVMKNGVIYDPAAIYRTIGVLGWREGQRAVP